MRFYDGHAGQAEIFVRTHDDSDCCAQFRSDFADRELPSWLRKHRGNSCPQHAAQRQLDLIWLGYVFTDRQVNAGMFSHLSVA